MQKTMKHVFQRENVFLDIPYHREADSISLIELLLKKGRLVACQRDLQGLTPLLKAATQSPLHFPTIEAIIKRCPESIEVRDDQGRTMLHLMKKLSSAEDYHKLFALNPAIEALKNYQDKEGNIPLHMALLNKDIALFCFLLKSGVDNLRVKNKDGVSVVDLIQQTDEFRELRILFQMKDMLKSRIRWREAIVPSKDVLKAAETLESKYLLQLEKDAYRHGSVTRLNNKEYTYLAESYQQIIELYPTYLYGKISNINMLNVIVRCTPEIVNKQFLVNVAKSYEKLKADHITTVGELFFDIPWKAKGTDGYTPFRIALVSAGGEYVRCARQLLEFDPTLKYEIYERRQTPLHTIMANESFGQLVNQDTSISDDLNFIIKEMADLVPVADADGLTPVQIAAKKNRLYLLEIKGESIALTKKDKLKDHDGNNICHQLANVEVTDSIRTREFLELGTWRALVLLSIQSKNNNGDTPLNLAIKLSNFQLALIYVEIISKLCIPDLGSCDNDGNSLFHLVAGKSQEQYAESFIRSALETIDNFGEFARIQNKEGNTAMHLAILKGDLLLVQMINQHAIKDSSWIKQVHCVRDGNGNTPMHLAILKGEFQIAEMITQYAMKDIYSIRNDDGNTPMHLAILQGEFPIVEMITQYAMKDVCSIGNIDGNTPLHLAILKGDFKIAHKINEYAIKDVYSIGNGDGNTPLHLAILKGEFEIAQVLIECASDAKCLDKIMELRNNKDETPNDLIGSANYLPYEFENFLWRKPKVVEAMLGVRSLSGVSTKTINDYSNTIGVIAALFATITFTAAFTVPGGSKDDNGTPILMNKAAFQVFMVADILAMCLSMIVLFFLLWIMTIGNQKHQVVLLDLTIFLLEGAFYAIILTFMTGLYATVFPVSHWIAILTCVLCSLLLLLMHKRFIVRLIPFFIQVYVLFRKAYTSIGEHVHRESNQNNEGTIRNVGQANEQTEQTEIVVDKPSIESNHQTSLVSKIRAFFSFFE